MEHQYQVNPSSPFFPPPLPHLLRTWPLQDREQMTSLSLTTGC